MARKFSSGDQVRIAHQDHNRWQDAGLAHAMNRFGAQQGFTQPDWSSDGIIMVKNETDRDLPRYAVLGLRTSIPDPKYSPEQLADFKNFVQMHGRVPLAADAGKFCVLQCDAKKNEVVPAMVSGVTPVKLSVTATTDEAADIDPSATDPTKYLKTGSGTAQILYAPAYTGEQWGIVRLGNKPSPWKLATASGTLSTTPYTPSSSGATQEHKYSALSTSDGTTSFEKVLTEDYILVKRTLNPCFVVSHATLTSEFIQNQWNRFTVNIQRQVEGSASWSSIGSSAFLHSVWPNVAKVSGASDNYGVSLMAAGIGLQSGDKIRVRSLVDYSSTAPLVNLVVSTSFWYQ
jgi:hypothetical protein